MNIAIFDAYLYMAKMLEEFAQEKYAATPIQQNQRARRECSVTMTIFFREYNVMKALSLMP